MRRQLIFIHGRAQEDKDSTELKQRWIRALEVGLEKAGEKLRLEEIDIRFPYFGDALRDLASGVEPGDEAAIIVRGAQESAKGLEFMESVLNEICRETGITDEEIAKFVDGEVLEKGPLNWLWVRGLLKAIDQLPYGSGAGIAMFTNDVYQYLHNSSLRLQIHKGVMSAFRGNASRIVVGHSLGSIVAYNLLVQEGDRREWKVPLFVTVGSPLGVKHIRRQLRDWEPLRCPRCAGRWLNAMDERDVVALYPLDQDHFPLEPELPAIENLRSVRNETPNRHGIEGYLSDAEVAKRVAVGLKGT